MSEKIIIYTCSFGGYDEIKEPLLTDDRFEYVLISDTPVNKKDSVWKFIHFDKGTMSPSVGSRYVKMHPHVFFPQDRYSVYIDAKMQITDQRFYDIVTDTIGKGIKWGAMGHPDRDCCYIEAVACVEQLRSSYFKARRQMKYFEKCGFPRHYGLTENCVMIRQHNDPDVKKVDTEWYRIFSEFKTGRDQLSLQFVSWKENVPLTVIFSRSWAFPGLVGHVHPNTKKRNFIQTKMLGAKIHLTRICNRILLTFPGKF